MQQIDSKNKFVMLVAEPGEIARPAIDLLQQHSDPEVEVYDDPSKVAKQDVNGLFIRSCTKIDEALLNNYPNLTTIVSARNGVDLIDTKLCEAKNIKIYHSREANVTSVANFILWAMLQYSLNVDYQSERLLKGQWRDVDYPSSELQSKTVGIVGYGRIGRRLAQELRGIGVTSILAFDNKQCDEQYVECVRDMPTLLKRADIVSLAVPLNDETRNMINIETLSYMKESALLINVARGEVVDERALITTLKARKIAGVVLDVFPDEPNVNRKLKKLAKNPKYKHAVHLTPHIASLGANVAMATEAVENFFANKAYPEY